MRLSNFFIESIGLYLPESYSTESAVADGSLDADTRERSGWTGTAVAGDISAPDMAVVAIREALSRSRYSGEDLALFLYGSSGIQGIPAWPAHHYVQRKAIGGTAPAVGIDASCNSTLLGFSLAAGYLSLLPAPQGRIDRRRRQLGGHLNSTGTGTRRVSRIAGRTSATQRVRSSSPPKPDSRGWSRW